MNFYCNAHWIMILHRIFTLSLLLIYTTPESISSIDLKTLVPFMTQLHHHTIYTVLR